VLVTGAGGFVGRALVAELAARERLVRAAVRRVGPTASSVAVAPGAQFVQIGALASSTDWRPALDDVDSVVHCAARVHVMHEKAMDPLAEFRRANVEGTLQLARQAAEAGVRRFIFLSSIGVNGAETFDKPFDPDDVPAPHSAYALAKHEAELGLRALSASSGLELVIIRPPLVVGPGAPGNLDRLTRALHRRLPMPFGAVDNRRSFVARANLVDLVATCLDHPSAAGQTFLASDGEDISTTALLNALAKALGRSARLVPVPVAWLTAVARLAGRPQVVQQLCGSLQVDISKTRGLLGWSPVVRLTDALEEVGREFLAHASR